jgi:hypothetical protein
MGFNLDDYEPVAARLDRWLKDHPTGRVITDLVHYLSDVAVFKAELWLDGEIIATGWAEEVRNSNHINKTSHVESCETSAVGRALANAGYAGSDVSKRPSREEMAKVNRMTTTQGETTITKPANAPSDKQLWLFKKLLKEAGKLPPLNIDQMDKFEVSRGIEALKNGGEPEMPPLPDEEPF